MAGHEPEVDSYLSVGLMPLAGVKEILTSAYVR